MKVCNARASRGGLGSWRAGSRRAREPQQVCELGVMSHCTGLRWSHSGLQLLGRPPLPALPTACLCLFRYLATGTPPRSGTSLPASDLRRQESGWHRASGKCPTRQSPRASWTTPRILPLPISTVPVHKEAEWRPASARQQRVPALSTSSLSCLQGQSCPPPQRASTSAAA